MLVNVNMKKSLDDLPTKAKRPLQELQKTGQISDETIQGVMDMIALGGREDHALAYAVAFQHLKANGTPIVDTLNMSKQLGRRINPRWSRTRWVEEHRKLGRVQTMNALSADNYHYNVSEFTKRLPSRFAGYVIKSSRRLGAEGLRQDHCVASYDKSLRLGGSSIAAVFVNKERWTVQLKIADECLRITQIKAKHNKPATTDVKAEIYRILGVDMPEERIQGQPDYDENAVGINLTTVCRALRALGVVRVEADFDGSGDSGMIYTPQITKPNEETGLPETVEIRRSDAQGNVDFLSIRKTWNPETNSYNTQTNQEELTLYDALERVIEQQIDEQPYNWFDGCGGYGEYALDTVEETYNLEMHVRHEDSECVVNIEEEPIQEL